MNPNRTLNDYEIKPSFSKIGDDQVLIVGAPFSVHQSSCSNHRPTSFSWSDGIQTSHEIFMDDMIPMGISTERPNKDIKRYAWVCESRAIVPEIRNMFDDEVKFNQMINAYDGIFTCEKELVEKHEKIHFCFAGSNLPWTKKENYKIYDKSKLVSFIASSKLMCSGHQFRHDLHERFKKRDDDAKSIEYQGKVWKKANESLIDVYGSILGKPFGYNPGCHLPFNAPDWHDKSEALNDYMFSVVLENDQYDDYFTEKITDCFATGTIPVYWGTKNIGDYFNINGIIQIDRDVERVNSIVNSLTPSLYYDRMDAIKDNFERVQKLQMADEMIVEKIRKLG